MFLLRTVTVRVPCPEVIEASGLSPASDQSYVAPGPASGTSAVSDWPPQTYPSLAEPANVIVALGGTQA